MLKRFIQTVAAAMLMGSAAMAADVAGTYKADTAKGPLVVEIRHDGGHLTGVIHYCNQDMPLVAEEMANVKVGYGIRGTYTVGGQPVEFVAGSVEEDSLNLRTAGTHYELQKVSGPAAPPAETQPAAREQSQGTWQQGKVFKYILPNNWKAAENETGVDITAPDGITRASSSLYMGRGATTPKATFDELVEAMKTLGWSNVKILSASEMKEKPGIQSTAYELTYDVKGTALQSTIIVRVMNHDTQYLAGVTTIEAPVRSFKQVENLARVAASSIAPLDFDKYIASQQK